MNRTSLAIILIIAAFLMAGFWGYLLYIVKEKELAVSALLAEIEVTQDKNTKLSSMQSLAEDVKLNITNLDNAFVKRDEIASFIDSLELLAVKLNVKISVSNLVVDDVSVDNIVGKLRIRIDIEGSEAPVHQFIGDIESREPVLTTNEVVLTRFENDKKSVSWKAALNVTGYVIN